MNKEKRSLSKFLFVRVLSLGLMILGIGFASLAMFSIWTQSHFSSDSISTNNSIATNFDIALNTLTSDNAVVVASDGSATNNNPPKALYPVYPVVSENIGSLTIPALKRKLPIIEGTDASQLKKGVGHFVQSVLPGEQDNCVLSGHRDTVFRQIGQLKIGDQLIVQTSAGLFTYAINGTRIVHADDKTVIVPTDHAVLTMTTCYPFNFIGNAPDRYIITADLVITK